MGTSLTGRHPELTSSIQQIVDALLFPTQPPGTAAGPRPHVFQLYAQLGDMQYEVAGPIAGLEGESKAKFAQHDVIEGKPRLQAIGDELEQLTLTLELHSGYCDPVAELSRLKSAMAAHAALPLVFASGEVRGRFVIEQMNETHNQHEASGIPVHVSVRVTLREWVEDQSIELASRRKRTAAPGVSPDQRATASTGDATWGTAGAADPHHTQPFRGHGTSATW